jgi:hypothetical protein
MRCTCSKPMELKFGMRAWPVWYCHWCGAVIPWDGRDEDQKAEKPEEMSDGKLGTKERTR